MKVEAPAARRASVEKEWWVRTLAVFQSPRAVFAALRNDADEQAEARQEPVIALVLLAGLAAILAWSPTTGTLLDQPGVDVLLAAVLTFLAGSMYGLAVYWIGGAVLHLGLRGAGATGTYRRSRHLLAYASAPLALSLLVVLPLRLALYGDDSFRGGGSDGGSGVALLAALSAGAALWALGLLVLGVAVVERWRIRRAAVAVALTMLAVFIVTVWLAMPLASG